MSTGAASKEMFPFTTDQKEVVGKLAFGAQLVGVVLLLLGVLCALGGPVISMSFGSGILTLSSCWFKAS